MQRESPSASVAPDCDLDAGSMQVHSGLPVFSSLVARNNEAKERLAHLARTIEADVIPRLVQAHRHTTPAANTATLSSPTQSSDQVAGFVALIVGDSDFDVQAAVDAKRRSGTSVEALYLDLARAKGLAGAQGLPGAGS